jgi:CheY-like chemotaxis protein
MKGTFGVSSTLGLGSTFWLQVPFALSSVVKPPTEASVSDDSSGSANISANGSTNVSSSDRTGRVLSGNIGDVDEGNSQADLPKAGKLTILITDDDRVTVNIMVKQLNRLGHYCDVAYDGSEVIQKIVVEKKRYDVIFMDDNMPNLSGIDTIKNLRANGILIPVIAITGESSDSKHNQLVDAGAMHVLLKPASIVVIDKLLQTIPSTVTKI